MNIGKKEKGGEAMPRPEEIPIEVPVEEPSETELEPSAPSKP